MKTFALKTVVVLLAFSLSITACKSPGTSSDDPGNDPVNGQKTIEDVKVPADFKWNTFNNIEFRVTGSETSAIRVVSKSGTVYHHSNLIEGNEYVFRAAIPAYERSVFLQYMGQKVEVDVIGSKIHHVFDNAQTFGSGERPLALNQRR